MITRRVVGSVAVFVLVVVGAVGIWMTVEANSDPPDPVAAARTSFPDLEHASAEPTLPSLNIMHPIPGKVVEAAGPFDDRFHFERLRFDGTTVSGTADITSDVSELLEFEALAGFYDRTGALVGTARYVHHLDATHSDHAPEENADQAHAFEIRVPQQLKGVAVAAAVGVPILVNE